MKNIYSLLISFTVLLFLLSACKKDNSSSPNSLSIKSINPASGAAGISDTITGTGFSATLAGDSVFFNGKGATILSADSTRLIVTVPAGAGTGHVSVTVNGKTASGPVFTFKIDSNSTANDSVYIVTTLAGSVGGGYANGTGSAAKFSVPNSVALDSGGNVYVNDYGNNAIRKITPAGVVTTFAGGGLAGNANGVGTAASFNGNQAIASDPLGNIYVAEWQNSDVRKISPAAAVSTFAGSQTDGYADGTGTAATFNRVAAIACDKQGTLYVFDVYNNRIRKITSGAVVSLFIGSGTPGSADGTGTAAQLGDVSGMCTDASGNVYMADDLYNTIRKITPAGVCTTIAGKADDSGNFLDADGVGTQASFAGPSSVASDQYGNLFVTDYAVGGATIRKITPAGVVSTIAGVPGVQGSADGPGHQATFQDPWGIVVAPNGVIYVSDGGNGTIRVLTPQR
jgi:serine/threonine-protein kinase